MERVIIMGFFNRLSDDEKVLVEDHAESRSRSLSEAFTCPFEKMEDEYDVALGQEAYAEYIANQKESHPISELWKECDL
jgi:hypothetical protein